MFAPLTHTLDDRSLRSYVAVRSAMTTALVRLREEQRGEGVISAAIAVLIMAFLGAAMWLAFKGIFQNASDKTSTNVDEIGK